MDIAELLQGRGATIDLDDGDIVTDMVVLCRLSKADGSTALDMATTEGTNWLDQYGLVKASANALDQAPWCDDEPAPENVHVIPVNDLTEHDTDTDCMCNPTTETVERDGRTTRLLVVHNALDGRE